MDNMIIFEMESPLRSSYRLHRLRFGQGTPHISIVSGLHGNELSSVYAINLVTNILKQQKIQGTIDLYPLVNSFGAEQCSKKWPFDGQDINRSFPGAADGSPTQRIADALLQATKESPICVDVHAGASHILELPQSRCSFDEEEVSLAAALGLPVVWKRDNLGKPSTLLGAWKERGKQTLHLVGGGGAGLERSLSQMLADGLLSMLYRLGMLPDFVPSTKTTFSSQIIESKQVIDIRAEQSGFFIPNVQVGDKISKDQLIGKMISPISGNQLKEYRIANDALVLSVRINPMIHNQELLLRLVVT